jgi:thiamine-phosphate pyrophosphorylase
MQSQITISTRRGVEQWRRLLKLVSKDTDRDIVLYLCVIFSSSIALAGGATVIQLREKKMSAADFVSLAHRIKILTSSKGVPLIINDRIDVALAAGADGVHIGQGDIPADVARRIIGPTMILGVSTKTVAQAQKAVMDGADYIGVGAVYETATKKDATNIGLEGLRKVCEAVQIPIVAIGGISLGESATAAIECGAQGVAVVSALFDVDNVELAAGALLHQVRSSRGKR